MSPFRIVFASLLILTSAKGQVSFESLLFEMTDRARLARVPNPSYSCAQASSNDCDFKVPDEPGWLANQDLERQRLKGKDWSGDRLLWWRDAKVDDQLRVGLEVEEAGWYGLDLALVRTHDSGIVRIAVNDEVVAEEIDNHSPEWTSTIFSAGRVRLRAGSNELRITIVGKHPEAGSRHMFGIDYFLLER